MWNAKQPRTWLELLIARIGYRRALRVSSFMVAWGLAEADLGRTITVDEYCRWWGAASKTTYRDLEYFREALPMFSTPSEWIEAVGDTHPAAPLPKGFVLEGGAA